MTDYTTLPTLRNTIDVQGSKHAVSMAQIITAASRMIDRTCGVRDNYFVADTAASAHVYTGSGGVIQWIEACIAITEVAVKTSTTDTTYEVWDTADWIPAAGDPEYPNFNITPYQFLMVAPSGRQGFFLSGKYTQLRGFRPDLESNPRGRGAPTVRVTAQWGYATNVPETIEQVCLIQSARWYKRALSSYGDTLMNAEMGQMLYTKPLDPDVKTLLVDGRWIQPALGGRPK